MRDTTGSAGNCPGLHGWLSTSPTHTPSLAIELLGLPKGPRDEVERLIDEIRGQRGAEVVWSLWPRLTAANTGGVVRVGDAEEPNAHAAAFAGALQLATERWHRLPSSASRQDFERLLGLLQKEALRASALPPAPGGEAQAAPQGGRAPADPFLDFPLKERLLLMALWNKGNVPLKDVLRAVWRDRATKAPADALHKLQTRANTRLMEKGYHLEVRRKGETLKLSSL
jgi:hypothetical protein